MGGGGLQVQMIEKSVVAARLHTPLLRADSSTAPKTRGKQAAAMAPPTLAQPRPLQC